MHLEHKCSRHSIDFKISFHGVVILCCRLQKHGRHYKKEYHNTTAFHGNIQVFDLYR